MARAFIDRLRDALIGQDPLSIEKHFHSLTSLVHPYMAHIPTINTVSKRVCFSTRAHHSTPRLNSAPCNSEIAISENKMLESRGK
jgi:hypothetical protein